MSSIASARSGATAGRAGSADRPEIASDFATDLLAGLSAHPKRLPPKHFYDAAGSRLFERITALPEYYPTRTELRILADHAEEIAAFIPNGAALVEFGSGSSTKVRLLLDKLPRLAAYVPVDISAEFLDDEAARLGDEFPHLSIVPVAADFTRGFVLPRGLARHPLAGFFPGSTIGNLERHEATLFLQRAGRVLGAGAMLVVGVDLVKDQRILNAAYNDAAGVTARFNLNLLTRINREVGANFHPECFEHHAVFNSRLNRIEMHLASVKRQKVRVDGETIEFRAGETIHTENSYKYTIESFGCLARGAGWRPTAVFTDDAKFFSVHALTLEGPAPGRM